MKIYEDCLRKQNTMTINSKQGEKILPKRQEITSIDEDMQEREPWYTVGGNVNWDSHYGKECRGCSKN